jgi:hypothetical protein
MPTGIRLIAAFLIFGTVAIIPACIAGVSRQPDNPYHQTILRIQITEQLRAIERDRHNQEDPPIMP